MRTQMCNRAKGWGWATVPRALGGGTLWSNLLRVWVDRTSTSGLGFNVGWDQTERRP